MGLLVFVGGGAALALAVRWWCPRLGWGWIAAYWLAAGAFFGASLVSSAVQVPADVVYGQGPWREMLAAAPGEPANPLLTDPPTQMVPWMALLRDRLRRFEAPLWSNEMGTGQPLLGNAQSAVLSPLGLLTAPLPPVRALPVEAALKVFLTLLLTHALLLELGAGAAGAAFGALAFGFSVFSVCWALYPLGMAVAWLPGVLLGVVRVWRDGRGGMAGLVGCALGMALSGHPETLAHTALAAGVVAVGLMAAGGTAGVEGVEGRGGARRRLRFAGRLAVAALLAAGLAAPALLPFVEALPESMRSRVVAGAAQAVQPPALGTRGLRVLVDPLAFGSPRDASYVGPWNYNELCSGYAGLLALALAVAAAITLRGRALAVVAGGALAAGAAFAVPPLLGLVRALPLLDRTANGRMRVLWVLALAVAGGLGLEELLARRRGRLAAAAALGAALGALLLVRPPEVAWERAWWLATLLSGAAVAAAFLWLGLRRPAPAEGRAARWAAWLAVAALGLDLALLNVRYNPVLPARYDLAPPPAIAAIAEMARDPAGVSRREGAPRAGALARGVSPDGGGGGAGSGPYRVIASGYDLTPNLAAFYGLWDPRANDPMQPARATLVLRLEIRPQEMMLHRRAYPAPFLSYLGVRYFLTRHDETLAPPWLPVWEGRGGRLWRNPRALPLLFMPRAWRAAHDARDALASTLANPDFAAAAVAEEPAGGPAAATAQAGDVALTALAANSLEADVASGTGGLVVSSVSFSRAWHLRLDGEEAPLVCVNAAFLGFRVPPGRHRASLAYRPAGWTWGLRACGCTAIALLLGVALPAARRRTSSSAGAMLSA